MYMITHDTVGPDLKSIFNAVCLEPFQVLQIVFVSLKNPLTIITALSDMMGIAVCDCSCDAGHGGNICGENLFVN